MPSQVRLFLNLHLEIGGKNMTDWSEKMAEKLKHRERAVQISEAAFVEKQQIKKELGPAVFAALKSDIGNEISALNANIGKKVLTLESHSSGEIIVRANIDDLSRRVSATFDPLSGLTCMSEKNSTGGGTNSRIDTFDLVVGPNGKLTFQASGISYGTGEIAKKMLESILE
jgi:hypothetical protein